MNTKVTLRMDDELIRRAKVYSRRSGRSLSALVADFFAQLDGSTPDDLPPKVRSLVGSLRGAEVGEADYRRHLEGKHR